MMSGIKGKVNAKQLEKFQEKLKALNDTQRKQWNEAALKELAARLLRKVVFRTPVGVYPKDSGKTGGTLRRNWAVGDVVKNGDSYEIEIYNSTEYSGYVEYGHRTRDYNGWVNGRFMLTISEAELKEDAPRILINKLNKFIRGALS